MIEYHHAELRRRYWWRFTWWWPTSHVLLGIPWLGLVLLVAGIDAIWKWARQPHPEVG